MPENTVDFAAAENGSGSAVTAESLATHYGVSTRTAERLIAKARTTL
ncbi:hypothetical protein [Streptomyces lavendulae]